MESQTIKLDNGFEFTFTDEREWIYKAIPFAPQKPKVQEKPAYKVIEEIEEAYEDYFEKMLVNCVKEITKQIV